MSHGVRFELFGPVRAWRDDAELALGSPQQRALLAMLLLAGGRQVSLEGMLYGLWGDGVPKAAVGAVRTYVHRLRRNFAAPSAGTAAVRIKSIGDGYALDPGTAEIDTDVFATRLAAGKAARAGQEARTAIQYMSDALALWHGMPLSGIPGPYAESQRLHFTERYLAAAEEKLELDVMTGQHVTAIAEIRALLREHPYHEALAELLMMALCKSGRQAEALVVFDDMRRRLSEELGIDPLPSLREMQGRILRSDGDLFRTASGGAVLALIK